MKLISRTEIAFARGISTFTLDKNIQRNWPSFPKHKTKEINTLYYCAESVKAFFDQLDGLKEYPGKITFKDIFAGKFQPQETKQHYLQLRERALLKTQQAASNKLKSAYK